MTILPMLALVAVQAERPYPLMLGDPAPKLAIGSWLRGGPVESFEPGKLYVIDFFATWCEPCKKELPSLSAMQTKYQGKVTFISVDVWDYEERVPALMASMGSKMSMAVALDKLPAVPSGEKNVPMWARDAGQTSKDWLLASGSGGIPAVFLVDGKGRVCWISGYGGGLEQAIQQELDGNYDLDGAVKGYAKFAGEAKVANDLDEQLFHARQAKNWDLALSLCDKILALGRNYGYHASTKFMLLLTKLHDKARAYDFAHAQLLSDNPASGAFEDMAKLICTQPGCTSLDFDLAEKLAVHANDLSLGRSGESIAAMAEVAFARGKKSEAIRLQRLAVSKMTDDEERGGAEKRLKEMGG